MKYIKLYTISKVSSRQSCPTHCQSSLAAWAKSIYI